MWSKELQELSREYFNYGSCSVKSVNGDYGILNIDYKNKIWKVELLTRHSSTIPTTFNSVDEMIKAGWAVD